MSHPSRWWRLVAYLGSLVVGLYVAFALANGLAMWQSWYDTLNYVGYTPTTGGWPVFWHGVLLPLSDRSIGAWTFGGGVAWAYETPREVFPYTWYKLPILLLAVLLMHTGCGLTYAALPITRRRCKVRWSHIVRVTLYGYVLFAPAVILFLVVAPDTVARTALGDLLAPAASLALYATPLLEVAWWTASTSRYLRMPHAWGVGVAVAVVGALFSLAVVGWIGLMAQLLF